VTSYHTLVLWLVIFACTAGVASSPIVFAGLWAKPSFKVAYVIALLFLIGLIVRAVLIGGRPWVGF
jgi:uncharacterized membrane protein YciS (DUF1049 family)